jgi:hypothetical protein
MNLSTFKEFETGRFYNESEANSGSSVIVLGNEIAKSLFEVRNPLVRMFVCMANVLP